VKELYLHVGLPRCASTFLQTKIFPYLNLHYVHRKEHINYKMDHIKYLKKVFKKSKVDVLYSSETILGLPEIVEDPVDTLKKYSVAFPDANIIIIKRDRATWLKSMYYRYMHREGYIDFNNYYDNILDHKLLNVDHHISRSRSLFNGRVTYIDFEDLQTDHKFFIGQICEFMRVQIPYYKNKKINANNYNIRGKIK